MDIDYINDIYWLIISLSHHIRKANSLTETSIDEMLCLTIEYV